MMKAVTLRQYLFLMIVFLGQLINSANAQTFYTDGPIEIWVRAGYVYVNDYYDVFGGNQEPVWYVWVADDDNLDGQGWRNDAGCIDRSCACYLWQGQPGGFNEQLMYQNYYSINTPQAFDIDMENWEDDCGTDCSYETCGCFICVDPDDAHCGRARVANDVYYRTAGPPCQWVGATDVVGGFDYYNCGGQWAVGMQFWWRYNATPSTGNYVWRGHNSVNWFEACNWSTSTIPTSTKDVIIPASGYTYAPTIPTGYGLAYCNTLTIQGTTTLTIQTSAAELLRITQ